MIKKIIFFTVVIIVGVLFCYTSYYSYYIENLYNMIDNALEEERYDDVAAIFTSYFDSESVVEKKETSEGVMFVYPSILTVSKTNADGEAYTTFEKGYSVYSFKLNIESFADQEISEGKYDNDSGINYTNGSQTYSYPFVVTEGDNPYNLCDVIGEIKCTEANISKSIVDEKLGGAINSISLLSSNGSALISYEGLNLKFEEEFFTWADQFIQTFEKCNAEGDEETWKEFFETWTTDYLNNPTYRKFHDSSVINPSSNIWKTVGVMAIYVIVAVLIGLLVFKGGKWFRKGKESLSTRYQKRPNIKGNTEKKVVEKKVIEAPAVDAEIVDTTKTEE